MLLMHARHAFWEINNDESLTRGRQETVEGLLLAKHGRAQGAKSTGTALGRGGSAQPEKAASFQSRFAPRRPPMSGLFNFRQTAGEDHH